MMLSVSTIPISQEYYKHIVFNYLIHVDRNFIRHSNILQDTDDYNFPPPFCCTIHFDPFGRLGEAHGISNFMTPNGALNKKKRDLKFDGQLRTPNKLFREMIVHFFPRRIWRVVFTEILCAELFREISFFFNI